MKIYQETISMLKELIPLIYIEKNFSNMKFLSYYTETANEMDNLIVVLYCGEDSLLSWFGEIINYHHTKHEF